MPGVTVTTQTGAGTVSEAGPLRSETSAPPAPSGDEQALEPFGGTDSFATALEAVGGRTVVAASREEAFAEVRRIAGERPVVADPDPDLQNVTAGLTVIDDPWQAEVGVTSAFVAVAETGTLVLLSHPDRPRGTSLVPRVHVAAVPRERLVATYADAMTKVAQLRPTPSGVQFITGPSSSGDIELTMVKGVHGPAEVHVVFYPE